MNIKTFYNKTVHFFYNKNSYIRMQYIIRKIPFGNFGHSFHIVNPSPWPLIMSIGLFFFTISLIQCFHCYSSWKLNMFIGFFIIVCSATLWWRDVIRESTYEGFHTRAVRRGLRYGMKLFILSEIMFFVSFFWAFFHSTLSPAVELGGIWPPDEIETLDPWGIPTANTILLFASGIFITVFHKALKHHYWNRLVNLYLYKPPIFGTFDSKRHTYFKKYHWRWGYNHRRGDDHLAARRPFFFASQTLLTPHVYSYSRLLVSREFLKIFNKKNSILNINDKSYFLNKFKLFWGFYRRLICSWHIGEWCIIRPLRVFYGTGTIFNTYYFAYDLLIWWYISPLNKIYGAIVGLDDLYGDKYNYREVFGDLMPNTICHPVHSFETPTNLIYRERRADVVLHYSNHTIRTGYTARFPGNPSFPASPTWNLPRRYPMGMLMDRGEWRILHHKWEWRLSLTAFAVLLCGVLFLTFQIIEYNLATYDISDGIFGSVFYMATGFHGIHVFIGLIYLGVCFFRFFKLNEFTRDRHLGLELAIWYWHFVDGVWLVLYGFFYHWGI